MDVETQEDGKVKTQRMGLYSRKDGRDVLLTVAHLKNGVAAGDLGKRVPRVHNNAVV